jgi:hypothetical protein
MVQHVFEWFYVYGAVAPTTGERFFLELPYLNMESFQLFVDTFAQAFPDSLNLLLLDNSGIHRAQRLMLPANVRLVFLPPYCPVFVPKPKRHRSSRRWRVRSSEPKRVPVSRKCRYAGAHRTRPCLGDIRLTSTQGRTAPNKRPSMRERQLVSIQ